MKSDVFLLSSSYRQTDTGTVVQLWGRSKKGNLTLLEDDSFNPYCYLTNLTKGMITDIKAMPFVKYVNKSQLKDRQGEIMDVWKVIVTHPKNLYMIKDTVENVNDVEIYRSDISHPLNYMYENDLGPRLTGVGDYDNNYTINTTKICNSDSKFDPPFTIMAFDIENFINVNIHPDKSIICIGVYWNNEKYIFYMDSGQPIYPKDKYHRSFHTESGMLLGFFNFINEEDPDIICGYNSDEYDWVHIKKRIDDLGIKAKIGRDGSEIFIREKYNKDGEVRHDISIRGRSSFDIWKSVRKYMSVPDETLGGVGKELGLGGKMDDIDSSKIDDHWAKHPKKVMEYCMRDTELTFQIMEHQKFIENIVSLAEVTKLPFDTVKEASSSRMVDSAMIRAFQAEGFAIPLHHQDEKPPDEENDLDAVSDKVEGGYVLKPVAGLYHYIGSADVKSMYPSQIKENNICWTTIADDEIDQYSEQDRAKMFNSIEWDKQIKNKRGDILDVVRTKHYFWKKEYKEGVIPRIMANLMNFRGELKKKRKGKDYDYYDRLQNAVKTGPLNSTYGVMLARFYRFSDPRVGESITAYSRQEIHAIADTMKALAPRDRSFNAVASDTDSVYCDFGSSDLETTLRYLKRLCKKASHGDIDLEPEKVYKVWFNHGRKKRYCGTVVWKDGEELNPPKTDIKGYELRRKDGCPLQKRYLKDAIYAILEEHDMNKHWGGVAESLNTQNFHPELEELIMSTSVRDPKHYKKDTEWRIKIHDALVSQGHAFFDGMRVSYIVTGIKPSTQYAVVIDGKTNGVPDLKYYKDKIVTTLAGKSAKKPGISVVFKYDRASLRNGMRKADLTEWM